MKENTIKNTDKGSTFSFGNPLIGIWRCFTGCKEEFFPRQLREMNSVKISQGRVICPKCNKNTLDYDEEA